MSRIEIINPNHIPNLIKICGCKVIYKTYIESVYADAFYNGVVYVPGSIFIEGDKGFLSHEEKCLKGRSVWYTRR